MWTLVKYGVEPEALWEYYNQPTNLPKLQAAVRQHAMTRSTAAYGELAKEFLSNLDTIDPAAILEADFGGKGSAHRDANGKIVVTSPNGTTMSWAAAVKAGLVRAA